MKKPCLTIVFVGLLFHVHESSAQDPQRGADVYKLCASCHGFRAEGNSLVHAPGLAGQEDWYLARQIRNFRDGVRGGAGDDVHGQTMATMTLSLARDEDIDDLVAYIGTLPTPVPQRTVTGDVESGRSLYQPCAACHGASAEGNAALNGPALVAMDDWYQLSQLKKFKEGRRGATSADLYGQQMAPMTATLSDERAMADVIAYITSLR